jgi:glyceraldehyde-3-phosphate dehydrogenase (NAD(P))
VIPETIDAIRALSGIERGAMQSIAKTNQSLGIVTEFLSVKQRVSAA